jgi:ferredoxin-fold anticodon binding domain-containing protein
MNNWSVEEIAFRCDRLSIRMERLAQNFLQIGSLSWDGVDAEAVLEIVRESKVFLELTAIDLDIENAFELAQIQRQLSRWHVHWLETWESDANRLEISTLSLAWANRIREMAGVFV